ncbi:hypothetical protein DRE_02191 [Drechslerella stenobrocha 248]|uniref:RWD domain-containing protein n=1 Tax=Drechslerella stenobrocha 248 TaxID=1043628 RepID=W7I8M0_9PEZI|nr:hypothetical protein DRE_02191 [Drechslerella stenobrocha 248]
MSASEEQEQELEVLESIYPDELTKISATEFSIKIALEEPDVDTEAEGYEAPAIVLRVTYSPDYPNQAPTLALSLPSLESGAPHSLSFPADEPPLVAALDTAVEENMGMAMVFTLTTTLKEAAEEILRSRAEEAERVRAEAARIEEEKEMEKFRGELVTREVFERWRESFMREVREKKEAAEREREEAEAKSGKKSGNVSGVGGAGKKLTGRELFERGLVGGADDDGEVDEEEATAAPDVSKLEIDA